jgi:putative ABC transport system permease protein
MLLNFLKISVRSISRSPANTLINVSGLALGLTCILLIYSMVTYHLRFDNFHRDADRIYRFVTEQHRDQISYSSSVPPVFGKAFREDYTFGEKVARLCTLTGRMVTVEQDKENKKFQEDVAFAESEYFDIFNFPLVNGERQNILSEPNTAVITKRIAKKYYGDESPIGRTFRFNNIEFRVTGILKEIPDNTDFRGEVFLSYGNIKEVSEWYAADDAWGGITSDIQTFTRLRIGVNPAEVEKVLPAYVKKYRAGSKNIHHYKLQPLKDIHFNREYGAMISHSVLMILSVIGFFLIFTACLNFVNLATAQAINRSREVGVRKSLGSARLQLFWQFTTETGVIVILATLAAYGISYAVLPYLNQFFGTRIVLNFFSGLQLPLFTLILVAIVTLLSSLYPGIVISGFKPVSALKGHVAHSRAGSINLRRALITTQFAISQVLLIGLIVIVYQVTFVKNTDLGFSQDGVVMIPVGSSDVKMNTLKAQMMQIPNVENVSLCFAAPASDNHWGTMLIYDSRPETENFSMSYRGADENYVSTFDLELVAGRNLQASDTVREYLVNETLVRFLGLNSPEDILGKTLSLADGSGKAPVVGVLKDFHDESMRSVINPVFISTSPERYNSYAVKINMTDTKNTLASLEQTWSEMYPDQIYEYGFVNEQTAQFYRAEETMLKLIQGFAFIALFIGCMGLYGLVSFMSVQKTKEIGIRKVLGGTISQILWIYGREFTRLVLIAFFVAAPVAGWLMSRWLQIYAYHIEITAWIFVLELGIIFFVVLMTVGYQSIKSAMMNPVRSLRAE